MAARRRRHNRPVPGDWATLVIRALLILVDWSLNGHGPR